VLKQLLKFCSILRFLQWKLQLPFAMWYICTPSELCCPFSLRAHYDGLAEQGDRGGLLIPPGVGDFCCAQFVTSGRQRVDKQGAVPDINNSRFMLDQPWRHEQWY